jgi:hypothetical protein
MLINLVSVHPSPSPQSIPLANAFLKAFAAKRDVSICLLDFFLGQDAATCAAKIAEQCPVAAGFSMYVWNRDFVGEIACALRRINPAIKLFCGGPEVTAAPETLISGGVFDFIIIGEGEVPFSSFCRDLAAGIDYSTIPGLIVPGSAIYPPPSPVANLDTIPSPYLTGIIDTNANPGILWQLSRGCSFTCDFCFDSRGLHGVRHFSQERLEAELRHFAATDVAQIFVLDSTFNLDPLRAKTLLKMIKKIAPDIHFHFEVRSEFIDREMAKLFAQLTCSLQIGLQSADSDVLKLVGRSFHKADFTKKIGLLNESGATFGFDLIYGLPGDSLNGFHHTLDYALSLYPNHLDIFPLAVLPGTRLASRAKSLNMQWDSSPPYLVETTEHFSSADMAAAAGLASACDIFYTRGKAVAWFNAVVAALGLKPSAFLQKFNAWLTEQHGCDTKESDLTDREIINLQQLFLRYIFGGKKTGRYLPLVLDLVNYHQQYAEVLLAPAPLNGVSSRTENTTCNTRPKLASTARIVHFSYDIEELLECGEPQIIRMYEHFSQSGSQAVIYRNNGTICTESLAIPYILMLENICADACNSLSGTGLSSKEADEFLFFALQEGILVNTA